MGFLKKIMDLFSQVFRSVPGVPPAPRPADLPDEIASAGEPKWLKLARGEIGQAEIAGPANNPVILSYYAKAGFAGINDETVPWCAGFANAMLESAGTPGSKSLAAREFLNWGKPVSKPYPGCVTVLWRGSPQSWQGHVGFYVGETATHVQLLGGNQGNKVSIASYPKNQVLGFREPVKPSNSRTLKSATAGVITAGLTSTTILQSQTDLFGIANTLKEMGVSMPMLSIAGQVLTLALFCAVVAARYSDLSEKGR
jgi:uncharacterized protein (TIGR02594 family)